MSDVIAAKKERLQELLNSRNAATAITYTNCWQQLNLKSWTQKNYQTK